MAIALAALLALAYAAGVRRLGARGRRWPIGRALALAGAVVAVAGATLPPLAGADRERFSAHATEHVLLGMVAPVLLALAAPLTLALQAGAPETQRRLLRVLHSRPARVATRPLVGWTLFGTTLFALYFSPLLAWSLESRLVHELVHLHLFTVGCLFAWPLVGIDATPGRLPHGARLLAVLAAVPFHAFLGLALVQGGTVLADGRWTLDDQQAGGAIMWAAGELLAGALAIVVFWQWAASDDRQAARLDRRAVDAQALSNRQSSVVEPGT